MHLLCEQSINATDEVCPCPIHFLPLIAALIGQRCENVKTWKKNLPIFGKSTGQILLKICTESFLTRICNFFIKIFVGHLDNNTKFLEKYKMKEKINVTNQS